MYIPSYSGLSRASKVCLLFLLGALLLTGCASTKEVANDNLARPSVNQTDPYEGFNRSMYGFNMGVDKYLLKPIADGYRYVTPDFMQSGVTNFFNNLKGINVVLNDLLQGKFKQSASDTGRFLTNSTFGVFGLFDVASDLGMEANIEDFGQTLAVWGVDQGPYLVLPILGPTTVRDGPAIIVDKAANPGTYFPGTGIIEGINERANADSALKFIDEAALDPYVFTRESFLQYRNNLINDGKTDATNYDLDLEEALMEEDAPVGEGKKPEAAENNAESVTVTSEAQSSDQKEGAAEAFDSMSRSFEDALTEFEQASTKLDAVDAKRYPRYRYR